MLPGGGATVQRQASPSIHIYRYVYVYVYIILCYLEEAHLFSAKPLCVGIRKGHEFFS